MKLELAKYTCAACSHVFSAPKLGPDSYGEFLLRTSSGKIAYLNALDDRSFKEVSGLLAINPKVSQLSATERSEILRHIYGEVACDRAEDGGTFVIGAHPPCPVCGSQEMESWEIIEPPEFIDIPIEPVSHRGWMNLSGPDKASLVNSVIS